MNYWSPGGEEQPRLCHPALDMKEAHIPAPGQAAMAPQGEQRGCCCSREVLEPLLPRAQAAEPQARHCSELHLLRLQSPGRSRFTCKEDMGGKGVGAHQDSRQEVCAVIKVEANKGSIPVDGWEDRLMACRIEEL